METFYVLTKVYDVPAQKAAEVLKDLLLYKGVVNRDKDLLVKAFGMFQETKGLSLLDCFLCVRVKRHKGKLLTFDVKLRNRCVTE